VLLLALGVELETRCSVPFEGFAESPKRFVAGAVPTALIRETTEAPSRDDDRLTAQLWPAGVSTAR
jgi:hypothetical protein